MRTDKGFLSSILMVKGLENYMDYVSRQGLMNLNLDQSGAERLTAILSDLEISYQSEIHEITISDGSILDDLHR